MRIALACLLLALLLGCLLACGCAQPPIIADCDELTCHYQTTKKRTNMICYGFYGQIGDGGCFILQSSPNLLITPQGK